MNKILYFYINLNRSEKRNAHMLNESTKLGLNFIRVCGIDMFDLLSTQKGCCDGMNYEIKNNVVFKPKKKEIAIMLSHIKTIEEFLATNNDIAIILEDDMSFKHVVNWTNIIDDILINAPYNWNILKLHSSLFRVVECNIQYLNKGKKFIPVNNASIQSAGCYMINRKTALNLINKYKINNVYTFPFEKEYCITEHILFTIPDVYMYTLPFICAIENNLTCCGNYNVADGQSNKIIHNYWQIKKQIA